MCESMSNVKDLIKEKLNQLSKEELVDALADVCTIYVTANITTQLSSANCIQQCVNDVQTNLQQVDNVLTQSQQGFDIHDVTHWQPIVLPKKK